MNTTSRKPSVGERIEALATHEGVELAAAVEAALDAYLSRSPQTNPCPNREGRRSS